MPHALPYFIKLKKEVKLFMQHLFETKKKLKQKNKMMFIESRCFFFMLFLFNFIYCDVDTYPIKSINLKNAYQPLWYKGYNTYNGLIPGN